MLVPMATVGRLGMGLRCRLAAGTGGSTAGIAEHKARTVCTRPSVSLGFSLAVRRTTPAASATATTAPAFNWSLLGRLSASQGGHGHHRYSHNSSSNASRSSDSTKWRPLGIVFGIGLIAAVATPSILGISPWPSVHCESPLAAKPAIKPPAATDGGRKGDLDSVVDAAEEDVDGDTIPAEQQDKPAEISSWVLLREIWRHIRPNWLLLLTIIAVTCASAAISIQTPLLIGQLITAVQGVLKEGHGAGLPDLSILNRPAANLLGLFGIQGFLTFLDITLVAKLGEDLALSLRRELYTSILKQDMSFYDNHMQGEIIGRLTQDVSEFKHTFKLCVTQGLKCTSQIIGSAYNLVRLSPSLTLTLVSTMPALYIFMNFYGVFLRHLSRKARLGDSDASGVAGEAVSNIRTVRAFATEDVELGRYLDAAQQSSSLNTYLGLHIGIFQGMTTVSIGSMILLILYYGGNLVGKGEMTGGQLMAYMVSTQNTQRSLALVGVLFGQVLKSLGSASRVFEYIHLEPTIPLTGGHAPSKLKGTIEFRNVDFTYPTRPDQTILQRFSLKIPVGQVVALCGSSGSGKSTVAQLVERFYEPQSGTILIDGIDIRKLDPKWLRRHIGYINQEPILFATSIMDNIRYGRPDATDEEVREAARKANAAEFIDGFPNKFETTVGERGVTLSGGQKQRIAIARAILKNPQILILDEATSALDTQSERVVQDALERLMKGRTVLVIAHRLSTIQAADCIVVLSGRDKETRPTGNVVEMGTHAELLKKKSAYYRLHNQTREE